MTNEKNFRMIQTQTCSSTARFDQPSERNTKRTMSATIKEIAEYANVSRGTVDRALHGRGGVRSDVEKRILAIAESVGYKPNSAAKALSNFKKKLTVGLLLPSINNPFFDELIRGVEDAQKAMDDYGVELRLMQMRGYNVEEQIRLIDQLLVDKIDMLALTPFDDSRIVEKINQTADSGVEVLTVNSDIAGTRRCCYIGVDFVQCGRVAGGLISLINNNANLLIVNGSPKMTAHGQRIDGFNKFLEERKTNIRIVSTVICNDNNFEAYDLVRGQLREHPEIDVVYVVGEVLLARALRFQNFICIRSALFALMMYRIPEICSGREKSAQRFVSSRINRATALCSNASTDSSVRSGKTRPMFCLKISSRSESRSCDRDPRER